MMPRSLSCPLSPLVLKFAEPVRSASPLRAPPRVFKKKPRPEGNAGRVLCGVRKCGQHRIMTSAVTAPVSGRQSVAHLRQSFRRGPQPKPSPERGLAREGIEIDTSTLADWVLDRLREHVLAAERLHVDDTTVPVLAKTKTRTGTVKANKYRQFSASNLAARGDDS